MRLRTFALAALLALAATPARAFVGEIVAGPASQVTHTYATPVVAAQVGGTLTFLNQDVQPHNVVSDAVGPDTQAWCAFYEAGACPLLWAPVTDAGGRTSLVRGLENATSGEHYGVYCRIHPSVRGTIVAL